MKLIADNQEIWLRQEVRIKNTRVLGSELNAKSTRNSGTVDKVRK